MNRTMRHAAARVLELPGIHWLVRRRMRSLGVIFMLHRMACPDLGTAGHRGEDLRALLSYLRRRKIRVVPVRDLVRDARRGAVADDGPRVAFTLDDGYRDQAVIAAPIFQEFSVPATIFPVVEFLDGTRWMWWDQLHVLLNQAPSGTYHLPLPSGGTGPVNLDSPTSRSRQKQRFEEEFKTCSSRERDEILGRWQEELQVELPELPPERYAPMTWDQARACEAAGVSIGPHTVTHPILAREPAERARWEMAESWRRLQQEVVDPVPLYCYSNGTPRDFGLREMNIAEELGLEGALSTIPGYLSLSPISNAGAVDPQAHLAIPRFSLPADLPSVQRIMSGLSPGLVHRVPAAGVATR